MFVDVVLALRTQMLANIVLALRTQMLANVVFALRTQMLANVILALRTQMTQIYMDSSFDGICNPRVSACGLQISWN